MEYIAHRINKISELKELENEFGVELDLRDDFDGNIYISHDPFKMGDSFEEYLKIYNHKTMILNIKSERIELKCIELLKKYNVTDYFFLDSSFPMIYLLSEKNEKNIALRLSEFEGLDTIYNMSGRVNWVWVDCFTKIPIGKREYDELKSYGYKLCFVSPELQGRENDINEYIEYLNSENINFDAICTKKYCIDKWKVKYKF